MRVSLLSLTGLGIIAVITTDKSVFWAAGLILGLFIGPCQSAARVWMAKRVAAEHTASMFGLFAFSGKVTSFIGPLFYAWLIAITGYERSGMTIVIILFLLGFFLLPPQDNAKS